MSRIAAIGAANQVEGFALAGAVVFVAEEPAAVDAAWRALPADVAVLVLTPAAAEILQPRLDEQPGLLPVVTPE